MNDRILKLTVVALWLALVVNIGFTCIIANDVKEMQRAAVFAPETKESVATISDLEELRTEIQSLAHPATIQRRTIDYILRQGEFHGSP